MDDVRVVDLTGFTIVGKMILPREPIKIIGLTIKTERLTFWQRVKAVFHG